MNIYLIRHGRQCSRLCSVNAGLSDEGFRQAALLGERLVRKKIDMVYSSDSLRALQTAQAANLYWNAELAVMEELREIDFGDMTGLSDAAIAERFEEFQREQAKMERDLPYPNGECAGDVVRRTYPVLLQIAREPYHDVAVVTHGGVIRSLTAHLLGMDLARWRQIGRNLENTGITELRYERETGRFTVERFNDYAHLEGYPELLRENRVRGGTGNQDTESGRKNMAQVSLEEQLEYFLNEQLDQIVISNPREKGGAARIKVRPLYLRLSSGSRGGGDGGSRRRRHMGTMGIGDTMGTTDAADTIGTADIIGTMGAADALDTADIMGAMGAAGTVDAAGFMDTAEEEPAAQDPQGSHGSHGLHSSQRVLAFQAEEFRGTQAFHKNLNRDETVRYLTDAMRRYKQMDLRSELGSMQVLVSKSGKRTVKVRRAKQAQRMPLPDKNGSRADGIEEKAGGTLAETKASPSGIAKRAVEGSAERKAGPGGIAETGADPHVPETRDAVHEEAETGPDGIAERAVERLAETKTGPGGTAGTGTAPHVPEARNAVHGKAKAGPGGIAKRSVEGSAETKAGPGGIAGKAVERLAETKACLGGTAEKAEDMPAETKASPGVLQEKDADRSRRDAEDQPGQGTEGSGVKMRSLSHNRRKRYILEEGRPVPFLMDLGVMTAEGKIVNARYDKFRQINRFLEFVEDILPQLPQDREIRILDFGCGRSYLTFAIYYYLHELKGYDVRIIGLDLKRDVIDHCNELAARYGYGKMEFLHGDIAEFDGTERADMVVTLHACDTATDYALAKAVGWKAKVILSVPCCQHELNGQMENELMKPIFRYGIVKERMAALYTDALRAEILENHGYRTQILEFIDMEHTPKNLLLRCVRDGRRRDNRRQIEEIVKFLGVEPTLLRLLGLEQEGGRRDGNLL